MYINIFISEYIHIIFISTRRHRRQWYQRWRRGRSTGNYVVSVWSPLVINLCRGFKSLVRRQSVARVHRKMSSADPAPASHARDQHAAIHNTYTYIIVIINTEREREKAYAETPGAHNNRRAADAAVLTFLLFRPSFA